MMRVKAHRHIPLRSRTRLQRVGVQQDPALPSRTQRRFRLQHLLQAARAYSQTERQGRRAAAAAEIQRKRRVQQRLLQLLQKCSVGAFDPGQKHGILQIMAVGHIRGLLVLRLCRVVVHQQLPFPLHADAEPQPGQSEQCFVLIPPQPQSCRQKTDHAALGGFTARLAGLKFGVRAPRL